MDISSTFLESSNDEILKILRIMIVAQMTGSEPGRVVICLKLFIALRIAVLNLQTYRNVQGRINTKKKSGHISFV